MVLALSCWWFFIYADDTLANNTSARELESIFSTVPGLFVPETALTARQAALPRLPEHGEGALRWRTVSIDHAAFDFVLSGDEARRVGSGPVSFGTIKVNLFENENIFVKNTYIDAHEDGSYAWTGKVINTCDTCSSVFFYIEADGTLSGSISFEGNSYRVVSTSRKAGYHVFYQINPQTVQPFNDVTDDGLPSKPPEEKKSDSNSSSKVPSTEGIFMFGRELLAPNTNVQIDLMFVYTNLAEKKMKTTHASAAAWLSEAWLQIEETFNSAGTANFSPNVRVVKTLKTTVSEIDIVDQNNNNNIDIVDDVIKFRNNQDIKAARIASGAGVNVKSGVRSS